ncbi:MAG TPA: efflux RND transporter permease subunit, partial [Myxococcaceae bacterium]
MTERRPGLAGRIAARTVNSPLTPLGVVAAVLLGVVSVLTTPREEEPQIIVPMVDVFVPLPGATPGEVEAEVTVGLEKRLWGIPGVEYVYSTSARDGALITARFRVNEPLEPSLVKVRQEIDAHPELLPPRALRPSVTLVTIDDVPVLTVTLHGGDLAPGVLRQLGQEVARELATIPEAAQVQVLGGARRVVRVEPDPRRLRELDVSLGEIRQAVQSADAEATAGSLVDRNRRMELSASTAVNGAEDLRRLVVARRGGRPILLGDVAQVSDGPERDPAVVLTASRQRPGFDQAVSVDVAKRRGANATLLADQVKTRLTALRGGLIPATVQVELTRNSGDTARERSDELIRHLLIATLSVVTLVGFAMGWRSALVVGIAVPVTLALTLLINQLLGHTLNRITLFALIFSIGILVDDAIVVVENVHRHLFDPERKHGLVRTVLDAVDEVGNPTILATFAVIAAILPMAFVRGLMGPYMRP